MRKKFIKKTYENKIYIFFTYQLHNGYVPIIEWIKLTYYSILLRIKRLLRMCKRISTYLMRYLIIGISVIVFESVIIPLGIYLKKYEVWTDGIWDLRNFVLTSIIISIVVSVSSIEIKRSKELRKQYIAYESFKYESTSFVVALCKIENVIFNLDIFQNEKNFEKFYQILQNGLKNDFLEEKHSLIVESDLLYSTKELPRSVVTIIYFEQYLRKLDRIKEIFLLSDFEGRIEDAVSQIEYIYDEIQAERLLIEKQEDNYSGEQLLKFVDCISRAIYPAIVYVRDPWWWDEKLNKKMTEIINEKGGFKLS